MSPTLQYDALVNLLCKVQIALQQIGMPAEAISISNLCDVLMDEPEISTKLARGMAAKLRESAKSTR